VTLQHTSCRETFKLKQLGENRDTFV